MMRLRVALIGPSRFPVIEPFAGGLEAHTWLLARALRDRGHHVTLYAAPGTDPLIADVHRPLELANTGALGRRDISGDPRLVLSEQRAYRHAVDEIRATRHQFDVVHNNSLHPTPLEIHGDPALRVLTTLHTPPRPEITSSQIGAHHQFVAVSAYTARSWGRHDLAAHVIANGVDTGCWRPGPGGHRLVWSGRMVPEKGPDLAIAAAREAGRPLDLAGPIGDEEFFGRHVEPQLDEDIRYVGHLGQYALARLVGSAATALVTPRWQEPFGLVAAEALACGTPVAGFARGGLPELVTSRTSRLVGTDDVHALAEAIDTCVQLDRAEARRHAVAHLSVDRMVDAYEQMYLGATRMVSIGSTRSPEPVDAVASA